MKRKAGRLLGAMLWLLLAPAAQACEHHAAEAPSATPEAIAQALTRYQKPLAAKDALPWAALLQAHALPKPGGEQCIDPAYPAFEVPPEIQAQHQKQATVRGFMQGEGRRFVLSPFPPDCADCPSLSPEQLVEVIAPASMPSQTKPVSVTGYFEVIRNRDEYRYGYRLIAR